MAETEERDLSELIPDEAFNHPDCFNSRRYGAWEHNIAEPILREKGFEVLGWYCQDADSFGPLVRAVELMKDGVKQTYYYG